MNLRLSPGAVRVRLSRSELDQLLISGEISANTQYMPNIAYTYAVVLDDAVTDLMLDASQTGIQLRLSADQARALAARLPSKEGIESQQIDDQGNVLAVSLEVDLHSKRNARG